MMKRKRPFLGLFVEDEKDQLDQFKKTIHTNFDGLVIKWEFVESFEEVEAQLETKKYDLVVSDIYLNLKETGRQISPPTKDASGFLMFMEVKQRFSIPWILISNASAPEGFEKNAGPFFRYVYKPDGPKVLNNTIKEVLESGFPEIRRNFLSAVEMDSANYLWSFLEKNWDDLRQGPFADDEILDRVIRNRAAVSLGKIDPSGESERNDAHSTEFYFYPPISPQNQYRLGSILKDKGDGMIRVVMNPHCHLAVQPEKKTPRTEWVVTAGTVLASSLIDREKENRNLLRGKIGDRPDKLARFIRPDFSIGSPSGRYWFLPGFLEIPDVFCDFSDIQSFKINEIEKRFAHIATLSPPFAENLQALFNAFFGSVGIPDLQPEDFMHLYPKDQGKKK